MSETTAEQVKERVGEGAQQVQQKAVEAKQQTRERMRQKVDTRSTQTGEQMTRTASAIRKTAQQLRGDQQEMPANVLDGVADRAERLGQYFTTTDGDRLLRDVEQFARRQPWLVAGGGAVLGFVASRFMKASSSRRYEQNGQQLELERGSSSVDAR
jgi:ElaB/YqjD/DUF883 family membrane-anchored ribosome-binding protein